MKMSVVNCLILLLLPHLHLQVLETIINECEHFGSASVQGNVKLFDVFVENFDVFRVFLPCCL